MTWFNILKSSAWDVWYVQNVNLPERVFNMVADNIDYSKFKTRGIKTKLSFKDLHEYWNLVSANTNLSANNYTSKLKEIAETVTAEGLSKRPDGLMVFDILHNIQKDEWYVILPTDMVDGGKLQFYMEE